MAHQIASPSFSDNAVEDVSRYSYFTVYQTTAPGTGTPNVQISEDGTTWHTVGPFGSGGFLHVTAVALKCRVNGGSGAAGAYVIRGIYADEGG
jgi:hypothetical protein